MLAFFSEVKGIFGINSVSEDKLMIFKAYRCPLLIHLRWYKLPLSICRGGDLSILQSGGEKHDTRDIFRMYKDNMRENVMEIGDPYDHAPTQQDLKIAERVAVYSSGDMDRVVLIDEREEQR